MKPSIHSPAGLLWTEPQTALVLKKSECELADLRIAGGIKCVEVGGNPMYSASQIYDYLRGLTVDCKDTCDA